MSIAEGVVHGANVVSKIENWGQSKGNLFLIYAQNRLPFLARQEASLMLPLKWLNAKISSILAF